MTAIIWGASPQTRSDRRKDRVETNPEQLAAASALAEISLMLLFNTCFVFSLFNMVNTFTKGIMKDHWHYVLQFGKSTLL